MGIGNVTAPKMRPWSRSTLPGLICSRLRRISDSREAPLTTSKLEQSSTTIGSVINNRPVFGVTYNHRVRNHNRKVDYGRTVMVQHGRPKISCHPLGPIAAVAPPTGRETPRERGGCTLATYPNEK